MPAPPPLDELLRAYLASEPGVAMARLQVAVERVADHISAHTAECVEYRRSIEARLGPLEHPSQRPPTMGAINKLVTESGSWDVSKIDKVIASREAAAALAQKRALLGAAGKVAMALLVAALLFAGGSFWRDLWGPRPVSNTSITTIDHR